MSLRRGRRINSASRPKISRINTKASQRITGTIRFSSHSTRACIVRRKNERKKSFDYHFGIKTRNKGWYAFVRRERFHFFVLVKNKRSREMISEYNHHWTTIDRSRWRAKGYKKSSELLVNFILPRTSFSNSLALRILVSVITDRPDIDHFSFVRIEFQAKCLLNYCSSSPYSSPSWLPSPKLGGVVGVAMVDTDTVDMVDCKSSNRQTRTSIDRRLSCVSAMATATVIHTTADGVSGVVKSRFDHVKNLFSLSDCVLTMDFLLLECIDVFHPPTNLKILVEAMHTRTSFSSSLPSNTEQLCVENNATSVKNSFFQI